MTSSTPRLRHLAPLWIVAASAALVGRAAHLVVPDEPLRWLGAASTAEAVPVVVWLGAVGVAFWLAITATAQVLLRSTGAPVQRRSVRWLDRVTPRLARAVALRAVGASTVAAVSLGAPAVAQPAPPGVRPPQVQLEPATASPTAPTAPATDGGSTYTVVAGDHFWSIAATHVAERLGRMPTTAEVAACWRVLVSDNAAAVPSGDIDVIHPGERYELPTWEHPTG